MGVNNMGERLVPGPKGYVCKNKHKKMIQAQLINIEGNGWKLIKDGKIINLPKIRPSVVSDIVISESGEHSDFSVSFNLWDNYDYDNEEWFVKNNVDIMYLPNRITYVYKIFISESKDDCECIWISTDYDNNLINF